MFQCQNFLPRADMNGDQIYTITDLWLQIKAIWLIPGNVGLEVLASVPGAVQFLELDCWSASGFIGAIVSGYLWGLVIMIVGSILMGMRKAAGN
ncbi:hypothetical protein [Hydrogenophaga sp.]|uniref:hypothetical protein n=1 Tax=Hydrogenophaga sp. TaxID=1904254 RepID=UPI001AC72DDD|nr:hypothetical protein [Hydrogenophaga sp.]MBN9370970.1 hypothetical protein [Hydrogenophaga sp.]